MPDYIFKGNIGMNERKNMVQIIGMIGLYQIGVQNGIVQIVILIILIKFQIQNLNI